MNEPVWDDEWIALNAPRYADPAVLARHVRDDERKPLLEKIAQLEQTISYLKNEVIAVLERENHELQGG
jgi:hypothetical protein